MPYISIIDRVSIDIINPFIKDFGRIKSFVVIATEEDAVSGIWAELAFLAISCVTFCANDLRIELLIKLWIRPTSLNLTSLLVG